MYFNSLPLFVVISIQFFQIIANVTPTISNSTGQYFITNDDTVRYNSVTIECNHPSLCYFECNRYGCTNLVLNISSASDLVIICNDHFGCSGDFNLSVVDNLFINCNDDDHCDRINVHIMNAENDNIIEGTTAYINVTNRNPNGASSYGWRVHKHFHLTNIDVVHMQCDGWLICSDDTLYCPSHREHACNVRCISHDACPEIDLTGWNDESLGLMVNENYTLNWLSFWSYDNFVNRVTCMDHGPDALIMTYNGINICKYYSNCCPYSSVKISSDDYTTGWYINDCIEGSDCLIDCSSQYTITGVLSECGYRIINASLSKSVTVLCPESNSCDNTQIICPINGGECNINVTGDDGSHGLRINTSFIGNELNINLNCLADNSCYDTHIFANSAVGSNINMNINCVSDDYACIKLNVDGSSSDLNNINIKYQRSGVWQGYSRQYYAYDEFYLYGASNVNIQCNGATSCYNAMFNLENGSNIDISCDGITYDEYGACRSSKFYVGGATNVNIKCTSFSCRGTNIFAAGSNKLDLLCDGDESCRDLSIIYPPVLSQYAFTLKCYDGIFDYSCNGIWIVLQDNVIDNFIDLLCQSDKACNYIYFHCDTRGTSILNPDDDYHSCLSNKCCPIDRSSFETNQTTASIQTTSTVTTKPIQTTNQPSSANTSTSMTFDKIVSTIEKTSINTEDWSRTENLTEFYTTASTKMANFNTDNAGLPMSLLTTHDPDFKSKSSTLDTSWFGVQWIVLIVVAIILCFIGAIYIAYKMGMKKQIKKQPVIPSFELVKIQDINDDGDVDTVR